ERAFVLIPLNDIASKHIEPRSQKLIENLVIADSTVKRYMS
ncbi:MAG: 2-amino-4-hydroxy-6-hydroxymethyldihydropteridine diphosphokinase, partial [Staphylococcus warneri]|nr:2-amino-4-hydroxy-6-hydroxymethyldihydropteridine diphosphokinase [Staphylococcus warneri]